MFRCKEGIEIWVEIKNHKRNLTLKDNIRKTIYEMRGNKDNFLPQAFWYMGTKEKRLSHDKEMKVLTFQQTISLARRSIMENNIHREECYIAFALSLTVALITHHEL